jgi:putative FmdB family regulatory protein
MPEEVQLQHVNGSLRPFIGAWEALQFAPIVSLLYTYCLALIRLEPVMPTYQYACNACGHEFEAVQSFSDASLTECPECKGEIRKIYSAVGVVFKGSGFYKTDSAKAAPAATPKAD